MEVWTACSARPSQSSDNLTPSDFLPFRHTIDLVVGINGNKSLPMLYDDDISVPFYLVSAIEDSTGISSPNEGAHSGGDVHSIVFCRTPYAEFSRDFTSYGPDETPFCRSDPHRILRASPSSSDIIDIDIDLQHLLYAWNKYLLSYPDFAGVLNVVYSGHLIDIDPIGFRYPPKGLVPFHRMINPCPRIARRDGAAPA